MSPTMPELDIDPFAEAGLADPNEFCHRVREAGPVVKLPQSEGHHLVGVGSDAVVRHLGEPRRFHAACQQQHP